MTKDDRAQDNAPPSRSQRRGSPPVLELAATEIDPRPQASGHGPESTAAPDPAAASAKARVGPFDRTAARSLAVAVGAAFVGALIAVVVILLFERGGDPRLTSLGSEIAV